jgi:hypothetical protein
MQPSSSGNLSYASIFRKKTNSNTQNVWYKTVTPYVNSDNRCKHRLSANSSVGATLDTGANRSPLLAVGPLFCFTRLSHTCVRIQYPIAPVLYSVNLYTSGLQAYALRSYLNNLTFNQQLYLLYTSYRQLANLESGGQY